MITANISPMGIVLQIGELTDHLSNENLEALIAELKPNNDTPAYEYGKQSRAVLVGSLANFYIDYMVTTDEAIAILKKHGFVVNDIRNEPTE